MSSIFTSTVQNTLSHNRYRISLFYRAMLYSAMRGICDVGGSGPHRLEILETNCTNN